MYDFYQFNLFNNSRLELELLVQNYLHCRELMSFTRALNRCLIALSWPGYQVKSFPYKKSVLYKQTLPVLAEDRVFQDDLLKQFDKFIREVSGHEGFHSTRYVLRILCLRQGCLHNLINKLSSKWIVFQQDVCPEVWVTTTHKISCLAFKQ